MRENYKAFNEESDVPEGRARRRNPPLFFLFLSKEVDIYDGKKNCINS